MFPASHQAHCRPRGIPALQASPRPLCRASLPDRCSISRPGLSGQRGEACQPFGARPGSGAERENKGALQPRGGRGAGSQEGEKARSSPTPLVQARAHVKGPIQQLSALPPQRAFEGSRNHSPNSCYRASPAVSPQPWAPQQRPCVRWPGLWAHTTAAREAGA